MESEERFGVADAAMAVELLSKMVNPPPSDQMMDPELVRLIKEFVSNITPDSPTPVEVWNFCKEMLDYTVRYAWGAPIVLTCLNLEVRARAPLGSYSQEFGNMNDAPWRNDPNN